VRKALNMALDKDIIAEKVLGQGSARRGYQPAGYRRCHAKNPDYASWPLDKRIAEAKKLLNEAGFNASHPLSFNLLYNTSESHQRIAIAASSMWKKNLGVEAKLQNQEWKTMLDTMHTHNFDAVRYAWIADYDDAATFLNNFRTGDSENTSQYSNPDYDQALVNAAKAKTPEERGKFYQQAEDLLGVMCRRFRFITTCRTHLVKPWVVDLRRISWGTTTPKICTSKNTKPELHVVLIKCQCVVNSTD
jgi:oligopeptide transport system substrate-binding protein